MIIKKCKICNNMFETYLSKKQKYCSKKCFYSDSINYIEIRKKAGKKGGEKTKERGREYFSQIGKIGRKNSTCMLGKTQSKKQKEAVSGKNSNFWKDGKSLGEYPIEFNSALKNKIRERDNYTCQKCGITEKEHLNLFNQKLCIHHIDYDKQNCNENNLITVCRKCNVYINEWREAYSIFFSKKLGLSNSKNIDILINFLEYCRKHKEFRFYQALRNWAEVPYIFAGDKLGSEVIGGRDTFYWRNKNG